MTIFAALSNYYDSLLAKDEMPQYGYSKENISFVIVLSQAGNVVGLQDVRLASGIQTKPRRLPVPQAAKRPGTFLKPFFLWDNTGYALGVERARTTGHSPLVETARKAASFKAFHDAALAGTDDDGLLAFLAFLAGSTPGAAQFGDLQFPEDMLGTNVVFRLEGTPEFLYERPAARAIWARLLEAEGADEGFCLATGDWARIARIHPAIKGVQGAQSSGASIVTSNVDAFDSYQKYQGLNAPTSKRVAFAYSSALNKLLRPESTQKVQIGDATTVFWADERRIAEHPAKSVERLLGGLIDPPRLNRDDDGWLRQAIESIAPGGTRTWAPELDLDARVPCHILGLSPNGSRLSIRFWHVDTLAGLVNCFRRFWNDLHVEPTSWDVVPSIRQVLAETAAQRKAEKVPPILAGELMRAVLAGERYPSILLTTVIRRIRADHTISGMRAAICKACLIGDNKRAPIRLDRRESSEGYRLGRLFAIQENIQRVVIGWDSTTIRHRYYSSASAAPALISPFLLRKSRHHLSKVRRLGKGPLADWFEQQISHILEPLGTQIPSTLHVADQARFALGYYHQRFTKQARAPAGAALEFRPSDDSG